MAIVFISPKERQRTFFVAITIIFLLLLASLFLGVFIVEPKPNKSLIVFNRPKVDINTSVFDTPQFKSLQPMPKMDIQYAYEATNRFRRTETGFITATSKEEATNVLKERGLTVVDIKEVQPGRDNPFVPYYKSTTTK